MFADLIFLAVMPLVSSAALAPLPQEFLEDHLDALGLSKVEAYWTVTDIPLSVWRTGIRIREVRARSRAAKAGLEAGDVILMVNGQDAWPESITFGQDAEVIRSFNSLVGRSGSVLFVSRSESFWEGRYLIRQVKKIEIKVDRD